MRRLAPELDRLLAPRRAPRRRRSALRIAVLTGVVAAAVFVVANVASTGNRSAVSSAQAQTILRHVHAALVFPPHAIYEEDDVGSVTARDGARFTTRTQQWVSTSPPYNQRLVRSWNGKVQWEQEFVNGRLDLYDPRTNTVYLAAGGVAANQSSLAPGPSSALSLVSDLLRGQVQDPAAPTITVNPNAELDGKNAIEVTDDRGRFSFWISPSTYKPLQSLDRWDRLPDGQAGVGIIRYPIARVLTGSAASPKLLSLRAQHPGATIDRSPTDYAAALSRMNNVDQLLRDRCTRSGCS